MMNRIAAVGVLVLSVLQSNPVHAKDLTYSLECAWGMSGNPPSNNYEYNVVKTAFKEESGKWASRYSLKVQPTIPGANPGYYDLVPAGSGDEDYNEYNVVDRGDKLAIQGAYIQNKFEWASLIDDKGYSSYDCRKPERTSDR